MFSIIFLYLVFAATFPIAKQAISYASPYFIVAFRLIVSGIIFLAYQYLFDRKNFFIQKKDLWLFFKAITFYIYLAFIPEYWALRRLTATKVVIIYALIPFATAGFAYFLTKERLTKTKIFGMIIGFLGMIPLIMTPDHAKSTAQEFLTVSLAEAVLLVAVIALAYGWFPVKKLMTRGYTLPMINGTTMLVGGICALFTSFAIDGIYPLPIYQTGPFLLFAFALIIMANGIYYNLYGKLLRRYSFTLVSFASFLSPIFGTFFGWLFLSDQIRWNHFATLGCIALGLYVFYREELQQ